MSIMDLQKLRYLKAAIQAIKMNLESLILSSPRGIYPITRHRAITRNYSIGNGQQLTPGNDNGRDLFVKDWKFNHNTNKKQRKHTTAIHKFIDAIGFENEYLSQGPRSSVDNVLISKKMACNIDDNCKLLTIHKSVLLVRHYSKLVPKVERWRSKDKKYRRQLAKLVDCVPGKNSDCGGGFFKNFFGKLFGGKGSTDQKCKPCRNLRGKQEKKVEEPEDDCDVPDKKPKATSKTKDDCDDKADEQVETKKVGKNEKCASRGDLKKADNKSCAGLSKTDGSSALICQKTSNRIKPSSSCSSGALTDRLKQLDTLEKCIGTLQQLIKNLKLEEELKRAANEEAFKPICPEPENPICPKPKECLPCPEPEKPLCPVPVKPLCPEPLKNPACPQPKKPVCPDPKKPVCPPSKKPVCPEPKKPVCPEPKKPVCPEPKKPVCPEPKKPVCPEKPICYKEESSDQCGEEKPYKCGIIEDINPPKIRRQHLRDKNDKYSAVCGKCGNNNAKHRDEQCPQKVKNCTDDDESNNC